MSNERKPVDVLAKYGQFVVESEYGDHISIVDDETLSVTIADVRGPNARERAQIIVDSVNRRAAVAELVDAIPALLAIARCEVPVTFGVIGRVEAALDAVRGGAK